MRINRIWQMPSTDTFDVPAIGEFVKSYLRNSKISVDPFARNKRWATYTNDLNPETEAEYHMDAVEFLEFLKSKDVQPDLIILDPPYSLHQVVKSYSRYGDKRVNALTPVYDLSAELVPLNGVVLNFGFNSNGICRDGFEIEQIMIVAHGGHHNDTICMAERRTAYQYGLAFSHTRVTQAVGRTKGAIMELPKEVVAEAKWHEEHRLFYERITCKCSCGREYLLIPINDDVVNCVCGNVIDSRLFSLSPRIRQSAQQPRALDAATPCAHRFHAEDEKDFICIDCGARTPRQ